MKNGKKIHKNKLKDFREPAMTQKRLAEKLRNRGFRVTESYMSQIEAGLKHIPYGLAIAIAEEVLGDPRRVTEIFLPESFTGSESELSATSEERKSA